MLRIHDDNRRVTDICFRGQPPAVRTALTAIESARLKVTTLNRELAAIVDLLRENPAAGALGAKVYSQAYARFFNPRMNERFDEAQDATRGFGTLLRALPVDPPAAVGNPDDLSDRHRARSDAEMCSAVRTQNRSVDEIMAWFAANETANELYDGASYSELAKSVASQGALPLASVGVGTLAGFGIKDIFVTVGEAVADCLHSNAAAAVAKVGVSAGSASLYFGAVSALPGAVAGAGMWRASVNDSTTAGAAAAGVVAGAVTLAPAVALGAIYGAPAMGVLAATAGYSIVRDVIQAMLPWDIFCRMQNSYIAELVHQLELALFVGTDIKLARLTRHDVNQLHRDVRTKCAIPLIDGASTSPARDKLPSGHPVQVHEKYTVVRADQGATPPPHVVSLSTMSRNPIRARERAWLVVGYTASSFAFLDGISHAINKSSLTSTLAWMYTGLTSLVPRIGNEVCDDIQAQIYNFRTTQPGTVPLYIGMIPYNQFWTQDGPNGYRGLFGPAVRAHRRRLANDPRWMEELIPMIANAAARCTANNITATIGAVATQFSTKDAATTGIGTNNPDNEGMQAAGAGFNGLTRYRGEVAAWIEKGLTTMLYEYRPAMPPPLPV